MRELYRPLYLIETPILFTSIETAELTKYAANTFLAAKITFINEIADLCEKVGADVQDVAKRHRPRRPYRPQVPACRRRAMAARAFPRIAGALMRTAQEAGAPLTIIETVVQVNDARKLHMADRVIAACGGSVKGKTLAVLGLAFKPNTDDMRESPSLAIVPALQEAGARIRAYDPEAMGEARKLLPDLTYCANSYDTMESADALVHHHRMERVPRASISRGSRRCCERRRWSICATSTSRPKWRRRASTISASGVRRPDRRLAQ